MSDQEKSERAVCTLVLPHHIHLHDHHDHHMRASVTDCQLVALAD